MPELPEVESTRRKLFPFIVNVKIKNVKVLHSTILDNISNHQLKNKICSKKIINIKRIGKNLFFQLEPNGVIHVHLGMTGRLIVDKQKPLHSRLEISLNNGEKLWFSDVRTFGKVAYFNEIPFKYRKFVDALDGEYSTQWLFQHFQKRKVPIKVALMDQQGIAGIGNIYANEILFYAKVSPFQKTHQLTYKQVAKIRQGIKVILTKAIEAEGTTFSDYYNPNGLPGNFQFQLAVYQREKLPCFRCKTPIQKTNFYQRGTYFCPQCQTQKQV
ncbi:MAG: DNA-formamidopyrimidine glycosylase [bacterium]|nr:DNA-formamidopyrimidine glycosylase [bacterium]